MIGYAGSGLTRYDADGGGERNPLYPLGYCSMSGHAEYGCDCAALHVALMFADIGISRVPGPSGRDLEEETAADRELVLDEFHGSDPQRRA